MLLLVHIIGAIMFLGGMLADMVWMTLAARTKNPSNMAFASRAVTMSDYFIALPGAALIMLSGVPMVLLPVALRLGLLDTLLYVMQIGWLVVSIALFSFSGVVWLFLLLPYQRRLSEISKQSIDSKSLPDDFFQLLHTWYFWAAVATGTPFIALVLMVLKPNLW